MCVPVFMPRWQLCSTVSKLVWTRTQLPKHCLSTVVACFVSCKSSRISSWPLAGTWNDGPAAGSYTWTRPSDPSIRHVLCLQRHINLCCIRVRSRSWCPENILYLLNFLQDHELSQYFQSISLSKFPVIEIDGRKMVWVPRATVSTETDWKLTLDYH